jgi:hypothetical protein
MAIAGMPTSASALAASSALAIDAAPAAPNGAGSRVTSTSSPFAASPGISAPAAVSTTASAPLRRRHACTTSPSALTLAGAAAEATPATSTGAVEAAPSCAVGPITGTLPENRLTSTPSP